MKIIKCPICGKPRYDVPFTDCDYCGWGYTGWEKFYKPDECEGYNSMSVNQSKAMVSAGKTVWNEPLPNKKITKKLKIILHIPHSSTYIPQSYWKNNLTMPRGKIENFNREIADLYTDELFGSNALCKIVFHTSRIVCDVERYVDDDKEEMSRFGMGVVYTKTHNGAEFYRPTETDKQKIIENYYKSHHSKLNKIVDCYLQTENKVLLIDCHSFSKEIIKQNERKGNLPDVCLGTENCTDSRLTDYIKSYFKNCGYTVAINYPYSGSMIPDAAQSVSADKFQSIMIEINKSLYLTADKQKNGNFYILQNQINNLLNQIIKEGTLK